LDVGIVHLPDGQRIEVELELARRAVCNGLVAGFLIAIALAVGEEADLVEILELFRRELAFEGFEELLRGVGRDALWYSVRKGIRIIG
jgi:hypothetical protein